MSSTGEIKGLAPNKRRRSHPCEITVQLSPEGMGYLKQLSANGLFGDCAEEVARTLLLEQLRSLAGDGWVE
jgi:hypothetical protein